MKGGGQLLGIVQKNIQDEWCGSLIHKNET